MTAGHPTIIVTNHSTVHTDAEVQGWLPAFQYAVSYQFAPSWGSSCRLLYGTVVPARAWQIVVLDDSDMAGALGYHDETADGYPLGKVFAKTDQQYGYNPTVTFTHELFEMLADPDLSRAYQTTNTTFHALEVGDPVEADNFAYENTAHPGVKISDFILPSWFGQGFEKVGSYDHCKFVTQPLQVLHGGYVSIFVSGQGWTTRNAQGETVEPDNDARFRNRG